MKNPFKSKKEKFPTTPVPRAALEINKAYSNLCAELGKAQYNVYTWQKHANALKEQILAVDVEMNARQKLDAEAKQQEVAAPASGTV